MIRCIIVDDEPLAIQLLSSYAEKIPSLELKATFDNPLEALSYLQKETIDLVFLDVQMPELNGMQVAKILPKTARIIFTTAYANYALEGFEVNALDYLLKPISFERFVHAVNRMESPIPVSTHPTRTQAHEEKKDSFFVKTEYRLQQVNFKDILFIKGLGDYCSIHTTDEKVLTLENMKSLEQRLPSWNFYRVHKSYIVSLDKIKFIEKNRIRIAEELIPIGQTYQERFWSMMNAK